MLYELRIYDIVAGRVPTIIDRFASVTMDFFHKHGIKPVLFGTSIIGPSNQFIYVLEWSSLAEREERWEAFANDPGWVAVMAEADREGPRDVHHSTNLILRDVPGIMARLRELQGQGAAR